MAETEKQKHSPEESVCQPAEMENTELEINKSKYFFQEYIINLWNTLVLESIQGALKIYIHA